MCWSKINRLIWGVPASTLHCGLEGPFLALPSDLALKWLEKYHYFYNVESLHIKRDGIKEILIGGGFQGLVE